MAAINKIFSFCIISFFLFTSCNKKNSEVSANTGSTLTELKFKDARKLNKSVELQKEDLLNLVESSGGLYKYEKHIDEYIFDLQYKPIDYIVALETINDTINSKEVESMRSNIGDFDYFTFKISTNTFKGEALRYKLNDEEEYYKRLAYTSSGMQNDIYLLSGKDSIPCGIYHFERTFGISPYLTVSLAFERSNSNEDRTLVFNDNLFDNGKVLISLPKEIFVYQPKLKIL